MSNNQDADGRLRQNPIPTHPADPAQRGEDDKVVGEPALQTPDYNAPPPQGAVKSTGPAADAGVGGALGQPPQAARSEGLLPADDDGEDGENQGGGDEVAEEVSSDQQSKQARKVGHQ
jgi:hypothetical protein